MRLISITWGSTPRLPGLRPSDTNRIECDKPSDALKGWRVSIRGTQIYFISPPGWHRDQSVRTRDPQGPRTAFGPIPASDAYLEWVAESDADVAALLDGKMKLDSPPFGWQPAPIAAGKPFLEPIPPGQMGDA